MHIVNSVIDNLPVHFLFSDLANQYPYAPESSVRRWIHTLVSRRKIVRLRRATGNRNAIYSKV